MYSDQQQRFTIRGKGHCLMPFVILTIGILLLVGIIFVNVFVLVFGTYYFMMFVPFAMILYGLVESILTGQNAIITIDTVEATLTMTVQDVGLRRCFGCCCRSRMYGTHTHRFCDILQISNTMSCGKAALQITFVDGTRFNSVARFNPAEAQRVGQIVNEYIIRSTDNRQLGYNYNAQPVLYASPPTVLPAQPYGQQVNPYQSLPQVYNPPVQPTIQQSPQASIQSGNTEFKV
ncbi:hypothetical protein BLNAU_15833 [Blattamonas nauphoetae]|uniref:Uncharacterized protein n=1 Tax=Blattamonas nauphoetae TaxID=2049346 RepID=A0ABQ9XDD4_9EUKA|nr:hypothetical protein BLNAU_15833 [Blattamonas nauphoetae]